MPDLKTVADGLADLNARCSMTISVEVDGVRASAFTALLSPACVDNQQRLVDYLDDIRRKLSAAADA